MVHLWLANMRQGNNTFHCSSEENKNGRRGMEGETEENIIWDTNS